METKGSMDCSGNQTIQLIGGLNEITVTSFSDGEISIWISEKNGKTNTRLDYSPKTKRCNLLSFGEEK